MATASVNWDAQSSSSRWYDALLLFLLAPVLIAGCFSAPPLSFDDPAHLGHELLSASTSWSDIFRATSNSTYFPLTLLSYRVDQWLYGSWLPLLFPHAGLAPGVRATSLLLHVLSGVLIWRTFLNLKAGRWLSLFVAAAWVAHPMACESVAWVSERKNVLAGFWGFAAVWAWCGGVQRRPLRELLAFLLYGLALLSKPTAAGFWVVFAAYELLNGRSGKLRGGTARPKSAVLPGLLTLAAMALTTLLVAKINVAQTQQAVVAPAGGNLFTAMLTDVPILLYYLKNALLPTSLSVFYYVEPVSSVASIRLWASILTLLAVVAGTVWLSTRRRMAIFLWLWFLGALGPALNIIPLPFLMQDRYAYFALPALLGIVGATLISAAQRLRIRVSCAFGLVTAAIVLVTLGTLAAARSVVFSNDLALYRNAVTRQPDSSYAHLFLALTLAESADLLEMADSGDTAGMSAARKEALVQVDGALAAPDFGRMIDPARVYVVQGALHERLGHDELAERLLHEALEMPQKPYNRLLGDLALARMALRASRPADALRWVAWGLAAIGSAEASPEAVFLEARCYEQLGEVNKAAALYRSLPATSLAGARAARHLRAISVHEH